ncbi:MAG: hypothetical protein NFCOHLIN_02156 [Gammaproteobacteria bacterium]|nr:hypothetical protein [Gammaproteobacteria bacterium]
MSRGAARQRGGMRPAPRGTESGRAPGGQSMRTVLAGVLSQYRSQLVVAEAGVLDDRDIEPLHEFRVAIRRTRALLRRFGECLDGRALKRFQRDFAWMATSAGRQRDLDVLLQRLRGERRPPLAREPAAALQAEIAERRRVARSGLLRLLTSARYGQLKADWFHFLDEQRISGAPSAPAREFAGASLRSGWEDFCRRCGRIGADSRYRRLHALRKDGKELRYAVEAFSELYGDDAIARLTRPLRRLQDDLGDLCDLHVQVGALGEMLVENEASDVAPPAAVAMRQWRREIREELRSARRQATERCRKFGRKRNRRRFRRMLEETAT